MDRYRTLKQKLQERKPILGSTITSVAWSGLIQKAASYSFDFMVFDLEHGTLSVESAEEQLRVCRLCGLPSVVRIQDAIPHLISKTLDMGADGLILPRVEKPTQVEMAVRAARYYPRGRKGCGGFSNFRPDDNADVHTYNDNRLLFIQIESGEGLQVLPELTARFQEELAGVIIGPYDASIMTGTPLNIHSDITTGFIKDVFSVCDAVKMPCGIFVDDASMIAKYRDLGASIFWTGTEVSLLCESYTRLCNEFQRETGSGV